MRKSNNRLVILYLIQYSNITKLISTLLIITFYNMLPLLFFINKNKTILYTFNKFAIL